MTSQTPRRWLAACWCLCVFLLPVRAATTGDDRWIGTWVSAQQIVEPHNLPPAPGLTDQILRQVIQPSLGGDRVRITVSNVFGNAPLTVRAAHVARSRGGSAIDTATGQALTFHGRSAVTIQPGSSFVSDAVPFQVAAFENLAVTLALGEVPSQLTGHPGSRTTSFIAAGPDPTAAELPAATGVDRWYLLSRVEVWAEPEAAAIVVIGDSITDGRGSITNENNRWPNQLARRLHQDPATAHLSVLNQGIGGGRLLREGLGPSALARFDRDVLALARVETLIVFIGVNDLGTAVGARSRGQPAATAEDIIAGLEQMIRRAHNHGIRVLGATIMPFGGFESYFTPESEADRRAVNRWIRTSGRFDGVIDFDAIARDPQDASRLAAAFDGGDHLHPSAEGYRLMAAAIDLSLFRTQTPVAAEADAAMAE